MEVEVAPHQRPCADDCPRSALQALPDLDTGYTEPPTCVPWHRSPNREAAEWMAHEPPDPRPDLRRFEAFGAQASDPVAGPCLQSMRGCWYFLCSAHKPPECDVAGLPNPLPQSLSVLQNDLPQGDERPELLPQLPWYLHLRAIGTMRGNHPHETTRFPPEKVHHPGGSGAQGP